MDLVGICSTSVITLLGNSRTSALRRWTLVAHHECSWHLRLHVVQVQGKRHVERYSDTLSNDLVICSSTTCLNAAWQLSTNIFSNLIFCWALMTADISLATKSISSSCTLMSPSVSSTCRSLAIFLAVFPFENLRTR